MIRMKSVLFIVLGASLVWAVIQLFSETDSRIDAVPAAPYPLREAELEPLLPSWAELTEDSLLHEESELPSSVRDKRTGIEYVLLPSGTFIMGSSTAYGYRDELPTINIFLSRNVYLSRHEVSVGSFKRFLQETNFDGAAVWQQTGSLPDDRPVVGVSLEDAEAFARWAEARLPTEAEFEYAMKGESAALKWPWGNDPNPGDAGIGIVVEEILFETPPERLLETLLQPCGTSERDVSWCGARGLAGNVSEWTADAYVAYRRLYPATSRISDPEAEVVLVDPKISAKSRFQTVRGGSWASDLGGARCSNRRYYRPDDRRDFIGLRVVRDP